MGISKSEKFSTAQNELATLTKALGHPARIAILEYLAGRNSCVCGDIVEELPLSQSTVSQHLKELKNTGLIKGTIEGPSVCYCIDAEAWETAKSVIKKFFEEVQVNMDCC
ncbi:MAG: metalloregulator ArsR/SmtB family transcription factor [Bacteroidota bacterium]